LLFEKFAFTSLNAIFNAASVDLPEDEKTPVIGRRAPNLTVSPEPECSHNSLVTICGLSTNKGSWINDQIDEDERAVPIMKITEKTESPVIAAKARLLDQAFPVLVDLLNSELVIRAELSKLFKELMLLFTVVRGVTKYTIDHKRPAAMITRLAAKIIADGHNSFVNDVTTKSSNQLSAITTRSIPADLQIHGVNHCGSFR
jgi:hypothetical protein